MAAPVAFELNALETDEVKLRAACKHLPIHKVVPNYAIGGDHTKKKYLKASQIRYLIQRQLKEQSVRATVSEFPEPNPVAHAFWCSAEKGENAAIKDRGELTACCGIGLASALEVGFNVVLWTYHREFMNLPQARRLQHLEMRDARALIPENIFLSMLRLNWAWGNISDVIRLRGAKLENGTSGSWVIDLDTIWLRTPSKSNCMSYTGHIFATCGAQNRVSEDARYWKYRYLREPEQRSYLVPPLYFPRRSSVLADIQAKLYDEGGPPKQYTYWLTCLEDILIEKGYSGDCQEVVTFHPVHNWVPLSALQDPRQETVGEKFRYAYNKAEFVLQKAVAFNNPWQTTMPGKGATNARCVSKLEFRSGSFFWKVLQHFQLEVLQQYVHPESYNLLRALTPPTKRVRYTRKQPVISLPSAGTSGWHLLVDQTTQTTDSDGATKAQHLHQIRDTIIHLRNSASVGVIWDHFTEDTRAYLLDTARARGLSRGLYWHACGE